MATIPMSVPGALGSSRKTGRTCIYCGSDELYRQRPRGIIEQHIFRAFDFVPYWCAACDRRFYLRLRRPQQRRFE
jgi:hypothetical protein